MKKAKNKKRYQRKDQSLKGSFKYAFSGLKYSFFAETNMFIHFLSFSIILLASAAFGLSALEWILIILVSFAVIVVELLNTALEVTIDMIEAFENPLARVVKDCGAAAVLMTSIAAVIVGLIIFIPKIMEFLT